MPGGNRPQPDHCEIIFQQPKSTRAARQDFFREHTLSLCCQFFRQLLTVQHQQLVAGQLSQNIILALLYLLALLSDHRGFILDRVAQGGQFTIELCLLFLQNINIRRNRTVQLTDFLNP